MIGARFTSVALVAMVALTACTDREKRVYFDGNYYPTSEGAVDRDDRAEFTVEVRRADQGLAGARRAGQHAGTKYCINTFGTSDIEWTIGPDAELDVLMRSGNNLNLRGTCLTW